MIGEEKGKNKEEVGREEEARGEKSSSGKGKAAQVKGNADCEEEEMIGEYKEFGRFGKMNRRGGHMKENDGAVIEVVKSPETPKRARAAVRQSQNPRAKEA